MQLLRACCNQLRINSPLGILLSFRRTLRLIMSTVQYDCINLNYIIYFFAPNLTILDLKSQEEFWVRPVLICLSDDTVVMLLTGVSMLLLWPMLACLQSAGLIALTTPSQVVTVFTLSARFHAGKQMTEKRNWSD